MTLRVRLWTNTPLCSKVHITEIPSQTCEVRFQNSPLLVISSANGASLSLTIIWSHFSHAFLSRKIRLPIIMINDPISLMEIIETNLFVDVDSLSANIVIASKSPDGLIDWIELKPEFHCSIVKCVVRLISKHTAKFKTASAKEALFPFLIKLLNGRATCTAFFHETKTTMLLKRANRERKRKVAEKLKVEVENTEKLEVKVNDTEAKKTPPDQAPVSSKMQDPVASSEPPRSPPKPSVIPILIPDPPVADLEPAEESIPEVVQFA